MFSLNKSPQTEVSGTIFGNGYEVTVRGVRPLGSFVVNRSGGGRVKGQWFDGIHHLVQLVT